MRFYVHFSCIFRGISNVLSLLTYDRDFLILLPGKAINGSKPNRANVGLEMREA